LKRSLTRRNNMFSGYYIKGSSMRRRNMLIAIGYKFVPRRMVYGQYDFEMNDEEIEDCCLVINVKRQDFWLADDTLVNPGDDPYYYVALPNDQPGPLPAKVLGYQKVDEDYFDKLLEKLIHWRRLSTK